MIQHHVPLAPYTSWRVGGVAERLYQPSNIDDLALFLSQLDPHEPITWIGGGTNLLIRDGGVLGTTIVIANTLDNIQNLGDNMLYVEAGVPDARFACFAAEAGLQGAEFLAGIPGTIGGALAMNAGAYGSEVWDYVDKVEVVNRKGERFTRSKSEYTLSYRHVVVPEDEWFVAGYFRLSSGDRAASMRRIKDLLARRKKSQPLDLANAGSVFRNPPGDYAARLIESAGLKGYRIGGASVSEKHANFIVNDCKATAADIEQLICAVQDKVGKAHGIRLITEVHIIGKPLS